MSDTKTPLWKALSAERIVELGKRGITIGVDDDGLYVATGRFGMTGHGKSPMLAVEALLRHRS